jgi:hypothetical protein
MKTFEEVWAEMESQGYQYGDDALEQVRLGWNLALEVAAVHLLGAAVAALENSPAAVQSTKEGEKHR